MKNLILITLLSFTIVVEAFPQSCLPDGIIFTTQAQLDSFQINYPNCTEIIGYVLVSGSDVNNFDSLIVLNKIWGGLSIDGGPLGGGHPLLINLTGFDSLTSIGGDFYIKFNDSLANFSGMESLNSIGGSLTITSNDALINLAGLNSLNTIDGTMVLWGNDHLSNLTGLDNLTSIGESLILGGYMGPILFGNPLLTSLTALENLTSIGGSLVIRKHKKLTSLVGLENIEDSSIYNLSIYENQNLSTCDIQSICDYLANPNGTIEIYNNNLGCNSQEEVEEACFVGATPKSLIEKKITIFPNPTINEFTIISKDLSLKELCIYNHIGQKVLSRITAFNKIDVSSLNSGVYFVEFVTNEMRITEKLVIK